MKNILPSSCGLIFLTLAVKRQITDAFVFPTTSQDSRWVKRSTGSPIRATSTNEKELREEITKKSTLVDAKDEIKYATTIGEGADLEGETISPNKDESRLDGNLQTKIEQALKPRAYPLFIAEKGAILAQDTIDSFLGNENSEGSTNGGTGTGVKERIVILGTGWGAAAFIKEIDAEQFDITVISPR